MTSALRNAPSRRLPSESTLWTSARMWQERVDDNCVLFAPDRRGLPVIVSRRVLAILDRCRAGAPIDSIVKSTCTCDTSLDSDQALGIVDFLTQRSFLREEADRPCYEARDVSDFRPDFFCIWIHISNHYNLDSAYCFVDKSQTEMFDPVIDRTIDYLSHTVSGRSIKNFTLKCSGGEPTLSMERFHDKLQRALANSPCTWNTTVLSNSRRTRSVRARHDLSQRGNDAEGRREDRDGNLDLPFSKEGLNLGRFRSRRDSAICIASDR
jgi:hypothetical protein